MTHFFPAVHNAIGIYIDVVQSIHYTARVSSCDYTLTVVRASHLNNSLRSEGSQQTMYKHTKTKSKVIAKTVCYGPIVDNLKKMLIFNSILGQFCGVETIEFDMNLIACIIIVLQYSRLSMHLDLVRSSKTDKNKSDYRFSANL